jgi:hypothetical protein
MKLDPGPRLQKLQIQKSGSLIEARSPEISRNETLKENAAERRLAMCIPQFPSQRKLLLF